MSGSRLRRRARNAGKRVLLGVHRAALRAGVVVLPRHYYVAVPDINVLARTRARWARRSAMVGVASDVEAQADALRTIVKPYQREYAGNRRFREATDGAAGPGFGFIEAQALHAVIRHLKPRRVVEVGSGASTAVMLEAVAMNDSPTTITCIEPHPRPWLRRAPVDLRPEPVQLVEPEFFEALDAGDLLFIDSTHTVQTGGDVPFLVLEVLPRLRPGVMVHIHDIFLPYDYQRDADRTFMQWQETALVHAFLIGNSGVEIMMCLSQLHYDRREVLHEVFPDYRPERDRDGLRDDAYGAFDRDPDYHFPSSLYLRIRDAGAASRHGGS